jgi:two-component system sensor histidine kinase/response regulator
MNSKPGGGGDRPRLLVIDDTEHNIALLERIFARGHDVACARTGAEGIAYLESQAFDVILLDVMLPDMSGIDILGMIRNTPELSDLPVLLISSLSDTTSVTAGLRAGANDYIGKPFDVDVTMARVKTQVSLKRLLDERRATIANLEAANRMKDQLMQLATHDLRHPINNLQILNQMLRSFVEENPQMSDYLDQARASINLMKDFIEQFLDARILEEEDEGPAFSLEEVPLPEVLDRVLRQYDHMARKKNIRLEIGDSDLHVKADLSRLTQVVSNLLSNAIKYSPPGSTVTIWAEREGAYGRMCVADHGPGIPADERELLFLPFSKLSNQPTGGESSVGLGLWIVKQLMTLQHGEVGVECPADGGSVFWVTLPAA